MVQKDSGGVSETGASRLADSTLMEPMSTDAIKEGTLASFAQDVLNASRERLILVDFWAPWCAPCRQLTPVLEALVRRSHGAVGLVKINVDTQQALALQMGIQSVPMVYLFRNGQAVDGFAGALPEHQIMALCAPWMEKLLSPSDILKAEAQAALDAGDWTQAEQHYRHLENESTEPAFARLGQALCAVRLGDVERAQGLWETVSLFDRETPMGRSVGAALQLAQQAQAPSEATSRWRQRLADDPEDLEARYEGAMECLVAGEVDGAVELLLSVVQRNSLWEDQKARKQLVTIFESLGFDHPVSVDGRKKLARLLFS